MSAKRMFPLEQVEAAMSAETGFCLACGEETADMVEPDATGYRCESCGNNSVVGAEQLVVMGRVQ